MSTYKHPVTGVKVRVADGKDLGHGWEPTEDDKKKPRTRANKKTDAKSDES